MISVIFSRIYRIGGVFSFFAANKYPVPIDAQHQKNVAQGYSPRPQNIKTKFDNFRPSVCSAQKRPDQVGTLLSRADRGATSFPVHKAVEVQGKYTCAFFVSATDDAKKCTAITAHVHRKCAVISVYFFASGKARLPKPPPSTGGLPSAYAFQTYAGILVIVCSAGLAGA